MDDILSGYLEEMAKSEASDLYLSVGHLPTFRLGKSMLTIHNASLTQDDINNLINQLLSPSQKEEFFAKLEFNFIIVGDNDNRFRINFFFQQQYPGMVIRRIRTHMPSIADLGLPAIFGELVLKNTGLILLSGPAGAGKSTSVAAMLEHRNLYSSGHIITIEDPVEYIFKPKNCIITQREVGIDTCSYGVGLKSALRQHPDVVFIGEIRDKETMEHALNFASTGHLCISTMNASNTSQTILRLMNLFNEDAQKAALVTLSQVLEAILSQKLVPVAQDKKQAVTEILLNVGLIKQLIREGRIPEIKDLLEKQHDQGMQTFDTALYKMCHANTISEEIALAYADNPSNLRLRFNQDRSLFHEF